MIKIITTICVLALLLHFTNAENKKYRFDYTYHQEIDGWLKMHVPSTWNDARIRCHAEGAVLASPLNEILLQSMTRMMKTNSSTSCGIFTGIHSTLSKGVYRSIEGFPLSKIPVHWAQNEPDNYENSEECLILLPDGTMADVQCNKTFPYLCYKKKTTNVVKKSCGTVDEKYKLDSRTGNCYKFHDICQSWHRAYMTCESEGGHLAIVNSQDEAKILTELFAKHPSSQIHCTYKDIAMLGFLDWNKEDYWTTIHSETLQEAGYSSWSNGQPDNFIVRKNGIALEQRCGAMFRSGMLDDVQCDQLLYPFICEKSPDSLLEDTITI